MQRTRVSKLIQRGAQVRSFSSRPASIRIYQVPTSVRPALQHKPHILSSTIRPFSITLPAQKGLSPDSENPQPKEAEPHALDVAPAELSNEKYNLLSDDYMDAIVSKLEEIQEKREDVDVEYSAGVLTLTIPPIGTYVINKQPPNKQIWLSSPMSGPKRYDYVILGEGQDSKEGTGAESWVYLRDMTTLADLLLSEVGVDLNDAYAPVPHLGE